jgi:stearoyl-CoA desaturase (delta-9 desaturase)
VYAYFFGVTTAEMALAFAYYAVSGMSITVGYHRLIAHRSFRCRRSLRALLLITGSSAWQGSALEWATEHVRHHANIDTESDPYNIKKGFWHAHVGWLFRKRDVGLEDAPAFLVSDPLIVLQHRYYVPLAVVTSFVIPFALAGIGGLFLAGVVRLVAVHHSTWLINSWAHTGRRRPYNPLISAVDNWFLAFFTFGEGFHNYHHAFPGDYRNGVAKLAWDPSKWVIWLFSRTGLAWGLRRISPTLQWRREIDTLVSGYETRAASFKAVMSARARLESTIRKTETRIHKLSARIHELQISSALELSELRAQMSAAIADWKTRHGDSNFPRVKRAQELVEHLAAYRELRARLIAYQSRLGMVPA